MSRKELARYALSYLPPTGWEPQWPWPDGRGAKEFVGSVLAKEAYARLWQGDEESLVEIGWLLANRNEQWFESCWIAAKSMTWYWMYAEFVSKPYIENLE